jgi:hypothetical protein
MKNPMPHLREATDAAAQIFYLKRDLYVLKAEIEAVRQAKRFALIAAGALSLNLALTLSLFWITQGLHESGWSAVRIAVASFLFLGSVSATLLACAFRPNNP